VYIGEVNKHAFIAPAQATTDVHAAALYNILRFVVEIIVRVWVTVISKTCSNHYSFKFQFATHSKIYSAFKNIVNCCIECIEIFFIILVASVLRIERVIFITNIFNIGAYKTLLCFYISFGSKNIR